MTNTDDRPIMCLDCDREVQLCESDLGTLIVRCDCERQSVKVAQATPEGWA